MKKQARKFKNCLDKTNQFLSLYGDKATAEKDSKGRNQIKIELVVISGKMAVSLVEIANENGLDCYFTSDSQTYKAIFIAY